MIGYIICIVFALVAPYFICALNPSIIVSKLSKGEDIRDVGSGNPGLTNTLRSFGKSSALIVLIFDILKGVIAMALILFVAGIFFTPAPGVFTPFRAQFAPNLFLWIGALSAVIGHAFPIYYGFSGGKSVLVTVATLFVIDWLSALILLGIFAFVVLLTRMVSAGSVFAAVAYPICVYFVGNSVNEKDFLAAVITLVFTVMIALLLLYNHKDNIVRIIDSTEDKIDLKALFSKEDEDDDGMY